ncbi:MAG: hypothetical protein JXB17_04750 [Bacteroidales bacterium]|nr:hypothetical protein [Bacteroidales bacterium]
MKNILLGLFAISFLLISCEEEKPVVYNPEDDMICWEEDLEDFALPNSGEVSVFDIACDNNDMPHIFYCNAGIFMHSWKNSNNWEEEEIQFVYESFLYGFDIDKNNTIHIISEINNGLGHVWKEQGGEWQNENILPYFTGGCYGDLSVSEDGTLHIVYKYGWDTLYYAYKLPGNNWIKKSIEDIERGYYFNIQTDNNAVYIVYQNSDDFSEYEGVVFAHKLYSENEFKKELISTDDDLGNAIQFGVKNGIVSMVHSSLRKVYGIKYTTNSSGNWVQSDPIVEEAERKGVDPNWNINEHVLKFPKISVDSKGGVHIIYSHTPVQLMPFIKYSYKAANSDIWKPEVIANTYSGPENRMAITTDSKNNIHVATVTAISSGISTSHWLKYGYRQAQ